MINEWMFKWEPTWLFIILFIETLVGLYTAIVVTMEYKYDAEKDAKKSKRTKTSKKVTDGTKITEEVTETIEGDSNVTH
jgi:hypothetical protein